MVLVVDFVVVDGVDGCGDTKATSPFGAKAIHRNVRVITCIRMSIVLIIASSSTFGSCTKEKIN